MRELFLLLKRFASTGPTEDELQRAIVRTVVDLELSSSNPEAIGAKLPWGLLAGRRVSLADEREHFKAVTVEKLAALCREIFRPENAALAVLGPDDDEGPIEKRLKKALVDGLG